MPAILTPYLMFDGGTARDAMTFYQSVFGGDLRGDEADDDENYYELLERRKKEAEGRRRVGRSTLRELEMPCIVAVSTPIGN